jgi:predicted amidohydrolase
VVQASTVGAAPWSLTVDENHGRGAIYGPVDRGFAADGVIAEGKLDSPGFTYADLSLTALDEVRKNGQVRNHLDWDCSVHLRDAEVVKLKLT